MNDPLAQTIRTHIETGNIDAIITLAESFRTQRDHAERKVEAYLHEIKILAQKFSAITEPATGRPISERLDRPAKVQDHQPPGKSTAPAPANRPKKGAQAIDIEL